MPDTVLLTGASGFIAKHILLKLLAAGHAVRAGVRSEAKATEVRAAVLPHLPAEAASRLVFVALDLTQEDGWSAAVAGTTALVHTASPFPIVQPKDESVLIRPAVEGTLRALRAANAAGVLRVILTSSSVAVLHRGPPEVQTEDDWADLSEPGTTAYAKSKTLAERAAWDFVTREAPAMRLTTINPGLVVGPLLDGGYGSSVGLVRRILSGKDPMQPAFGLPIVDVRDVAEMHLRALERPATAGRRYIAAAGSLWMADMAKALKAAVPQRRIATAVAPTLLLRVLALFDAEVRTILPALGHLPQVSNRRAADEMDMAFIPPGTALRDTALDLIARGLA